MKDIFGRASKYLAAVLLAVCLAAFLPAVGGESSDFGNFAGDSDYGGGGGGGGGGWSGGNDWSDSYHAGSSDYHFFDDEDDDVSTAIGVGVIVLIFVINFFLDRRSGGSGRGRQPQGAAPTTRALSPVSAYLKLDPNFDEAALREHMANLYVQMQDGWHKKDIEAVRPWLTDAFYNQMERLLAENRAKHETDYIERISVLETSLKGFYQAHGMDYLVAKVRTRITAYTLDDKTGKLVSGDRKREKFMEYEWELSRRRGAQTDKADGGVKAACCPHCGAPLSINASAQCPYCGSVVLASGKHWAVCSIKGISQRTA